jgi:hypothetical protein
LFVDIDRGGDLDRHGIEAHHKRRMADVGSDVRLLILSQSGRNK